MQGAAASLPPAARAPRLLALHGWRTSAAVLQQQVMGIRAMWVGHTQDTADDGGLHTPLGRLSG